MPLNAAKLLALEIPEVEQTYGPKDCILYALGLGLGQDPLNNDELPFVYEKNLKVLPTFAVMQGYAAFWLRRPELGVTWSKVVHGEHGFTLHEPVAPQGTVIGKTRILDVVDKGEGKGALIYSERKIVDKPSGRLLATLKQTTFCRADGGFGGPKRETAPGAIITRLGDSEPQDRGCSGDSNLPTCEQAGICSSPATARCNPANYLDIADASVAPGLTGPEDNKNFADSSNTDGFIAGPVRNAAGQTLPRVRSNSMNSASVFMTWVITC